LALVLNFPFQFNLAPGFYDTTNRLNKTNAYFVDIIHTSIIGLQVSVGHQDFYPNNGLSQPGCLSLLDLSCNHMRAIDLYAESIISQIKFQTSVPCSWSKYWDLGLCNCKSNCNHMGFYANMGLMQKISGDFYLSTNSRFPFSKN
jgi:hypothetical protein